MKMVQVKWNKSHPGYGYFKGQQGEVSAEAVQDLSDKGFIQVLPGDDDVDDNPLPEDLEARVVLWENGFTEDKIKAASQEVLMAIRGIGAATADKIIAYYAPQE